ERCTVSFLRCGCLAAASLPLRGGGAPPPAAPPPAGATGDASAPAAPLPQRTRVVLGLIPVIPSATIFVPKDKGYFDAEGLDVDWEVVQVTSEAMAQVATGNLQLAQATVGAALLNAFASGLDIRILAGMHGMPPSGPRGDP